MSPLLAILAGCIGAISDDEESAATQPVDDSSASTTTKPDSAGETGETGVVDPVYTKDSPCVSKKEIDASSKGVLSPSEGATLSRSPWVPFMVEMDKMLVGGITARVWLDCVDITDPHGFVRARASTLGGGNDYIAMLNIHNLQPGEHEIMAEFKDEKGNIVWKQTRFEFERPDHRLTITTRDNDGNLVNARVHMRKDGEDYVIVGPDSKQVDPQQRDAILSSIYTVNGRYSLYVEPGEYELIATRSPLHTIGTRTLNIAADREVTLVTDEAFDLGDWSTGDLHTHTGSSVDSFLPDEIRVRALAAAGLDMVTITDHDEVVHFEPVITDLLGENTALKVMPGAELTVRAEVDETTTSIGHLNAMPLMPGLDLPTQIESTWPNYIDEIRELQQTKNPIEDGLIQINHARGIQLGYGYPLLDVHDLWNELGLDTSGQRGVGTNAWMAETSDLGTSALDFEAMELLNRSGWTAYSLLRDDWFAFLNWGVRMTATGNADSHALNTEWLGYPMNLVPCAPPKPSEELDAQCWVDAVRSGQLKVTNGPLVDLTLTSGKYDANPGAMIEARKGGVHARIRVRAAPWVPVRQVRLVVGGRRVLNQNIDDAKLRDERGVLDTVIETNVSLEGRDDWVVAEAGWPIESSYPKDKSELGYYGTIIRGHLPAGWTNPVWIDQDRDGVWTPAPASAD